MAFHVNISSPIAAQHFIDASAAAAAAPCKLLRPRSGASSPPCATDANASSFVPSRQQLKLLSMPLPLARGKSSGRAVESLFVVKASAQTGGRVREYEDGEALEKYIQEAADKLIVLDISTKTCGPCKLIYPKLVKLSIDYPDVVFLKINGDNNTSTRELMKKWDIRAVPSFRFYRNGKLIHSHSGAKEDELRGHFLTHYKTVSV